MSENQTWNLPPPPGFRGLDPHLPLMSYYRHLPHWRQNGATYFVTFRQADALPQTKLHELRSIQSEWERRHPPPRSDESWETLARETVRRVDEWLDQGMGSCRLRDPRAAKIVANALHHFDTNVGWASDQTPRPAYGTSEPKIYPVNADGLEAHPTGEFSRQNRYKLGCYVIMPNHVHVVVRPLRPGEHSLEDILHSWKSFTAHKLNALFSDRDAFWQQESFDRIIRDEEHLYRVIQYIARNPVKAYLCAGQFRLWIRPEWKEHGWGFAD